MITALNDVSAPSVIAVEDLVFDYATVRALHGVSFEVERGSVTALVGPNGAGKTTLLRCMAALDTPFSGRVLVEGEDAHEEPRAIHRRLGYLSDFFGLYDDLTVRQCLRHAVAMHGVEGDAEAGFKAPLEKLRGIAAIYPNFIQIVASKESGIKTLAEVRHPPVVR